MIVKVIETHDSDPFGHHSARSAGVFMDSWGLGPLLLRYKGRVWRFEFSNMFGPALLTEKGNVSERQPVHENHPFWEAFNAWMDAGKRHRAVFTTRGKLRFYLCYARPVCGCGVAPGVTRCPCKEG